MPRAARSVNGTCAATAATPNAGSSSATATRRSGTGSTRSSRSKSTRRWVSWPCCVEPASVVAKAWDHIERIGGRSEAWSPRSVLVCGAGPIGLLAALLGVQRGYPVVVVDRVSDGPKPRLVTDLGADYRCRRDRAAGGIRRHRDRVHGRARRGGRRARQHQRRRDRVPDRRLLGGPDRAVRCGRGEPRDGAGQRCCVRVGQRQPPPLRSGGHRSRCWPIPAGWPG